MAVKPTTYGLDSFALLAYQKGGAGMSHVQTLFQQAERGEHTLNVSLTNLGEVLYITAREAGLTKAREVLAALEQLPIQFVSVSRATVLSAAHVKAGHPVAYADAFAAGTAQDYKAMLVTGDPEFQSMADVGAITVDWLPRH